MKEVAPSVKYKSDKELGVAEFQAKYFLNNPVYYDESWSFYNFLGNRNVFQQKFTTWNPFMLISNLNTTLNRVKRRKVTGFYLGTSFLRLVNKVVYCS